MAAHTKSTPRFEFEAASADASAQTSALKHAQEALAHWKQCAAAYDRLYKPHLLNRAGPCDIPALTANAAEDIEIIRIWKPSALIQSGMRTGKDKAARQ